MKSNKKKTKRELLVENLKSVLPPALFDTLHIPKDLKFEGKVVYVFGPPGSGKTSFCSNFSDTHLRFHTDDLMYFTPCKTFLRQVRQQNVILWDDFEKASLCEAFGAGTVRLGTFLATSLKANLVIENPIAYKDLIAYNEEKYVFILESAQICHERAIKRHFDSKENSTWRLKTAFNDDVERFYLPSLQSAAQFMVFSGTFEDNKLEILKNGKKATIRELLDEANKAKERCIQIASVEKSQNFTKNKNRASRQSSSARVKQRT